MKKLNIVLLIILSGCNPKIAGTSCASKCKTIGAYKYKVNPYELTRCECYVHLKDNEEALKGE